jgi:ATP-dependent helicase/nuclease subunit B
MQSTDPGDVEKARLDKFRLNGLAPDDIDLLQAQSPNFTQVLNVKVNADGGLRKGTLVTDANGFAALMKKTLEKAGEHLDAIRSGLAQAAPAILRQQNACQYCDWRSICQYDERLDGGSARRFEPMKADEVMKRLKLDR